MFDDGHGEALLPGIAPAWSSSADVRVSLPRKFLNLATRVAAHRDPERWDLLYRIAFRLLFENRNLLEVFVDDDVHRLIALDAAVRRDVHKMHAFVRFRQVDEMFVAWYQPDHRILRLAAPFFVERFRSMRWSILTPDDSAQWDGSALVWGPGVPRSAAPAEDEMEDLWRTYYASIFNPARTNVAKMKADMPQRFWRDMPELRDVSRLLSEAPGRVGSMIEAQRSAPSAAPFVPAVADLDQLRAAARSCEGCDLHGPATQTVFGEGSPDASIVLVGEQPGNDEDLRGRPFVGPAGELLDRALEAAGVDRSALYVTNAVKHFAYIERGTRRIHRTPRMIEVTACRPWLNAELQSIDPSLIVCMGATAARALLGSKISVMRDRGRFFTSREGREVLVTIHPSAVLRVDAAARDEYFHMLVADLTLVAERLRASRSLTS